MIVTKVIIDQASTRKRTPDWVFYIRDGNIVRIARFIDQDAAEKARAALIQEGATPYGD